MAVIDDDELSRELLAMLVAEAGFSAETFASGEEALVWLRDRHEPPAVVLTDMQMPGISGAELAVWLREACGPRTRLLAMSGSPVDEQKLELFDGFLLKPFSAAELDAACVGSAQKPLGHEGGDAGDSSTRDASVLNEEVYGKFAKAMPPAQVAGLYQMCLDDAKKRVETMRQAVDAGDDAAYRGAAHAIKGGCGMVGATELHRLAAAMETEGLPPRVGKMPNHAPLQLFLAASLRLGRMLESKVASA